MSGSPTPPAPNRFREVGALYRRAGTPVRQPFVARLLDSAMLPAVRHIHRTVLRLVPEPGIVRADPDAFFAHHFAGEGRILGVLVAGRLIAYAVLGLPATADYPYDRFGDDLGLPAAERWRIAQLIGVGVLPEWRGNGLHRRLCEWRMALARAVDRPHVAAVASPRNPHSWRNLLAVGLRVESIKLLGGDKLRFLLHADLRGSSAPDPATAVAVPATAIEEQRALLARGYRGYAPVAEADGDRIEYARPRVT